MKLIVENLTCTRGGVAVLAGVNLSLHPGTALTLRGPNGSGKTTLLRTIAGLQRPRAGTIRVDPDAIAYAGHADGIKATLSVADNLRFWAGIFGTGSITPAVAAFDLADLVDRAAQNLSAGQKRRLGLAQLLVTGRPIWLLDEPTVSLDTDSVAMFAAAITAHLASGGSALIATHIDLGLQADTLDVSQFRAGPGAHADAFDEAFL